MNCKLMIELMQRYVDHDLTEEEELQLVTHVRTCGQCASTFKKLKLLSAELEQLPEVKPRYSVVDTILPKLAEIDRQQQSEREESAAIVHTDSADQPYNNTRTRRFFTNISWKVTGSVAIAACAVMFFIMNGSTPSFNPETVNSLSAPVSDAAEPPVTDTTSNQASSPMSTRGQESATDSPSAVEDKLDKPSTRTNPDDGLVPAPSPKEPEVSALTHQSKNTQTDKRSAVNETPKEQGSHGGIEPSDASNGGSEQSIDSLESGTYEGLSEDSGTKGLIGHQMTFKVTGENYLANRDLRTANAEYVAEVKDGKLTISTAAKNELVFTSLRQWSDTEEISSIVWVENNRLYYEVIDNQKVHGYVIDVVLKTEQLIK
ncbi:hypothetical protein E0485_11245 [Paenibacillus albiflavus]|uniref:Anti-sigma-W factor RsiW n=1 Tax=Paenibacillus albiflavus TaxID=2545760 RepID=A0A4R4EBI5_9BACL|nr:zf-HC2 domain-containing protein [Paenibacillus albiflavus]TCZ77039.1 hypothetical protein E0485_11245 [Paenibacillus albiflavus]